MALAGSHEIVDESLRRRLRTVTRKNALDGIKREILAFSTVAFEHKYAPLSQSKHFQPHGSMRGHVFINLALVSVAGCGDFQQMNEPTRRGDHANDRARTGRAAEVGSDKEQTVSVP
jgi:hypothetical protein